MNKNKTVQHEPSKAPEPLLGIFWLIDGKLVFDSMPLTEAVPYGSSVTHPADHIDLWEVWKRNGRAPEGSEYEEYPRGRTIHALASGEVTIYADRCILQRKEIIEQIRKALHLPKGCKVDTDEHYRCSKCLYGNTEESDDDE
jgi:hypothetical protein